MADLTSIVILGWNQLQYSVSCIESIRKYTDVPYELILVDNGSVDGTYDYFCSVSGAKVIRNQTNLGFAAGCNQGIRIAEGCNILLLNNDTVVTYNWLANMVKCLRSQEEIGIVSCLTNFVGSENAYPALYNSIENYHYFAFNFNQTDPTKWRPISSNWLSGFCLLIKKELIDKIGLLDERFQYGSHEDVDFSHRALKAGYKLYIAGDTYIHHYGNRTFVGNNLSLNDILAKNQILRYKKWQNMK